MTHLPSIRSIEGVACWLTPRPSTAPVTAGRQDPSFLVSTPQTPPMTTPPPSSPEQTDIKIKKVSVRACLPCKVSHTSCDHGRPCQRCVTKGRAHNCIDVPSRRGLKQRQRYLESQRHDPYRQAERHLLEPRKRTFCDAGHPIPVRQALSTTFHGTFYPSPSPPAPSPSPPFLHAHTSLHTPVSSTKSSSPAPLDSYRFGRYVAEDLSYEAWERSRAEEVVRQFKEQITWC